MKKRSILIALTLLAVVAIAFPVRGAVAGLVPNSQGAEVQQAMPPAGMEELLNYPYDVHIVDLEEPERQLVLDKLLARPETVALMGEMAAKGFVFDPATADVMLIEITTDTDPVEVEAMTMSTILEDVANDLLLSGALTAMLPTDGSEGFFQAHHTNLDPHLADLPDPVIYVNGMPYFYITTLHWIGGPIDGRIIYWNYWWFDSGHHPNWYYAHYYWYWHYYGWYGYAWPYWYWWGYGWYYWHYWYYWSTWFPF